MSIVIGDELGRVRDLLVTTSQHLRLLEMSHAALLAVLSPKIRDAWVCHYKSNCQKLGIDIETGEPLPSLVHPCGVPHES